MGYVLEDGTIGSGPSDERPADVIAAEIAQAKPLEDPGDGTAPPDPDENLRRFVEGVTAPDERKRGGGWLGGYREHVPDAGPVPSTRFL